MHFNLKEVKLGPPYELFRKAQGLLWRADKIDIEADKVTIANWGLASATFDRVLYKSLLASSILDSFRFRTISLKLLGHSDEYDAAIGHLIASECNHYEMYCLLFKSLFPDPLLRICEFSFVESYETSQGKTDWATKNIRHTANIIVAYACTKGIFGSIRFAAGICYKMRGGLVGFSAANERIYAEIRLHLDIAGKLFQSKRRTEVSESVVHDIVKSAVEFEKLDGRQLLFCQVFDIKESEMDLYIDYCADEVLKSLGYDVLYGTPIPKCFETIRAQMPKSLMVIMPDKR